MKKILLAFDGGHFSKGAFEFVRQMHALDPICLTGVFLPQVESMSWGTKDTIGSIYIPIEEGENNIEVQKNIELFGTLCSKAGIEYRVHKDFDDFSIPSLARESRFADLLVLGSESFYQNLGTGKLNIYLKTAIHESECPVLVVPEQFDLPEYNVLAYDGSASSVFACKQFVYLFPQLSNNKTLLLHIGKENDIPNKLLMEELAGKHFPDLSFLTLVDSSPGFLNWIRKRSNTLLVSGAFGRGSISQLFKKSFVLDVIKEHKFPVFIAHK